MDQYNLDEIERKKKIKKDFNDLKSMMYGFGDDKNPLDETVELVDDYLNDFIINLSKRALKRGKRRDPNSNEIHKDDVIFFL